MTLLTGIDAMDQATAVELTTHRLDPVEAEVRAVGDVISGRLMGPHCQYASTVEIAYYFRPVAGGACRAIVPEPSLWEPQTPFLYHALLDLRGGAKLSRFHGLRHVQLGSAALRFNGRAIKINGVFREQLTDAADLRAAGINTIVCPVSPGASPIWDDADRLGFFVLGLMTRDADSFAAARSLKGHASCLGWLLETADVLDPALLQTRSGREPLLGLLMDTPLAEIPTWVQFTAGSVPATDRSLPWLHVSDQPENLANAPLGVVRR
jgi:hypothetical protein